jgi:nucleotide-binding universal stress UspA family protein
MYKQILVPLDQSELAEQALPHAAAVAQAMGSVVTLVAVVDVLDEDTMRAAGAAMDWEGQIETLGTYLQAICGRLGEQGVRCNWEVLKGDIVEEILEFVEDHEEDLIIMATHGRSGLARWVHGSVADRLVAQTPVPMLLVRVEE